MDPCRPVIAVFSYGGIEGPTLDSYVNEMLFAQRKGIPLLQTRVHGDALISRSRSKALSGFLNLDPATANVFFMLDHDLEWDEGDILATCAKAHECQAIVGGIYSCRGFNMGHSGRFAKEGVVMKPGADVLHEAEFIGGGFVAIPRIVAEEVLKKGLSDVKVSDTSDAGTRNLDTALHECIYTDATSFYDFFRPVVVPGTLNPSDKRHEYLSEDWSFNWRARAAAPSRPQYLWSAPVLRHWGSHGYTMATSPKKGA